MIRRYLKAFRVAFWEALHNETRRHVQRLSVKVDVDTLEAYEAIAALETRLTALARKADLVADSLGRIH